MPKLAEKQGRKGQRTVIRMNDEVEKPSQQVSEEEELRAIDKKNDELFHELLRLKAGEKREGLPKAWNEAVFVYPRKSFRPDKENAFDWMSDDQWEAMNELLKLDYVLGFSTYSDEEVVQAVVAVVERAHNPVDCRYDESNNILYVANRHRAPAQRSAWRS